MACPLTEAIVEALADPAAVKVLAAAGHGGEVQAAFKSSLRLRADGFLEHDELLETSRTQAALVHALRFDQTVLILVLTPEGRAFQIKGRPRRAVVSGAEFRRRYQEVRRLEPLTDLSAVWLIEPLSADETTLAVRRREEEAKHPLLGHLDRLTA
ncbi:MAG: hypothetical protein LBU12_06465 [Deltaproteobacteria bacterium]|jgi:hypothetical protein|nr:hypothetical protein [Deltaproteobacteria bacterium]